MKDNEVWELVELPKGRKAVGSKQEYKVKTDADGSLERYKSTTSGPDSQKSTEMTTMKPFAQWSSLNHFTLRQYSMV